MSCSSNESSCLQGFVAENSWGSRTYLSVGELLGVFIILGSLLYAVIVGALRAGASFKLHYAKIPAIQGHPLKGDEVKLQGQPDSSDEEEEQVWTPYDAVLKFTSLSSFVENNEIQILQSVKSELGISSSCELRIVAVVGLFDKGKTFSINMLFGKSLTSSKLHSTQGLSFLYIEEYEMLVVDTAGIQATVSYRPEKKGNVEPVVDAQTTETFLFELISRISDMLIFVVNDFTWVEQRQVAMFHQKDLLHGRQRELIVLHNLKTTTSVKEAEKLFENQIASRYTGKKSNLANLVYVARTPESPAIHHVTICKEGSAAGQEYNKTNAEYVMKKLAYGMGISNRGPFVLTDLLSVGISDLLPTFFLIDADDWKVEFERPATTSEQENGYMLAGKIAAKKGKLTMKTQGVIGEFGDVVAYDASFTPVCNIYEEHTDHEQVRTIQIECPGVPEDHVKITLHPSGVKVSLVKIKTIDEAKVFPVTRIREVHGPWEKVFDVQERDFQLCPWSPWSMDNGILKIILRRSTLVQEEIRPQRNRDRATVASNVSEASWQAVSEAWSTIHLDATGPSEHAELRGPHAPAAASPVAAGPVSEAGGGSSQDGICVAAQSQEDDTEHHTTFKATANASAASSFAAPSRIWARALSPVRDTQVPGEQPPAEESKDVVQIERTAEESSGTLEAASNDPAEAPADEDSLPDGSASEALLGVSAPADEDSSPDGSFPEPLVSPGATAAAENGASATKEDSPKEALCGPHAPAAASRVAAAAEVVPPQPTLESKDAVQIERTAEESSGTPQAHHQCPSRRLSWAVKAFDCGERSSPKVEAASSDQAEAPADEDSSPDGSDSEQGDSEAWVSLGATAAAENGASATKDQLRQAARKEAAPKKAAPKKAAPKEVAHL